jgi:hypothetical protein
MRGGGETAILRIAAIRLRSSRMLRISWPLAILAAAVIAVVARRPRLLLPILVVFVVWYLWERSQRKK